MSDYAVCPFCGVVTEFTDKDAENDPNLDVECEECGGKFNLYTAEFTEEKPAR